MQAYRLRVVKRAKDAPGASATRWVALADSADQATTITLSHLSPGDAVTDCETIDMDAPVVVKLRLSKGEAKQL
jgi:hypothetical protein